MAVNSSKSRKEIYSKVPKQNTIEFGEYTSKVFSLKNIEPIKTLEYDPTNLDSQKKIANEWKRIGKLRRSRAGLESGRYFRERNRDFRENYAKALRKQPHSDLFEKYANAIEKLPLNSMIYFADILPKLHDWYPTNKNRYGISYYSDKQRQNSSYSLDNPDLMEEKLMEDLDEAFNILGIDIDEE